MKAAVFDGQNLTLKSVDKPKINDSQVMIRVKSVGICGTDLAIVNKSLATTTPIILGHEFAGDVVEIGSEVKNEWLNKRVTSEINSNIDFKCYYCKQGINSQCVSRKALGIDIDGALAEFIAVDSYMLHEIPDSISYDDATFIEPLAAAYQTFEVMPLDQNDSTMAIFGLGKLGLLLTQVALSKGLKLFVVDGSHKKIALAKNFGAHYPLNRFEVPNVPKKIKSLTNGLGADIVADTTGNPIALKDIIASCRARGKIHIKSTHGIDTPVDLTDVVIRELTIYSSRCGPFEKAIEGLSSGKIKVVKLISKKYNLEDIGKAVKHFEEIHHHIKTVIHI